MIDLIRKQQILARSRYLSKHQHQTLIYTAAARSKTEINPSVGNIAAVKCLSLNQPYAELLISGKKTIEVRRWNTNFRGQFLIHASKKINEEACNRLKIDQAKLVTGAIVGNANLYDVISYQSKF